MGAGYGNGTVPWSSFLTSADLLNCTSCPTVSFRNMKKGVGTIFVVALIIITAITTLFHLRTSRRSRLKARRCWQSKTPVWLNFLPG